MMGNSSLYEGNLNPLGWLYNLVMPKSIMFAEGDPPVEDPPPPAPPSPPPTWFEGLEEDVRNHPSSEKFKDKTPNDVVKSYINLEKKLGANPLVIPKEGASAEEVAEFHKALGRPDTEDGYEIIKPVEGSDARIKVDAVAEKDFKDFAFKSGLSKSMAKSLQEFDLQRQQKALAAYDKTVETERVDAEAKLRAEWGGDFDKNLEGAKKVLTKFGGDEALAWMDKGQGNNPTVIKMLANIAKNFTEDALVGKSATSLTMGKAEAQAEIDSIRNDPKHAHNDDTHKGHQDAIQYMKMLYQIAYPEVKE